MLRKLLDSPWTYYGLAGVLAVVAVLSAIDFRLPSRPVGGVEDLDQLRERDDVNVVFIVIDTLRSDHLGSYGYSRDTSPIMDLLAGEGIRFSRVLAQSSWTKSSMASLWTGAYPRRVGVTRYSHGVDEKATLPAEILQEAGFLTGGIYRNGWVEANFGFGQGFDLYYRPKFPSATPRKLEQGNPTANSLMGSDWDVTESAVEFLQSNANSRFFLYLHYMDVHQYLFDVESSLFGTTIEDGYDNAIHWTDRNVSVLMRALDDRDLLEKTLVVIASDHGEAFYEHGREGHARDLYRETTETPLFFFLPFRLKPGIVVDTPVQNVDVWPTILDLLGLPPLPHADGRSLVPLIRAAAAGESAPADFVDRAGFSELDRFWGKTAEEPKPTVALVEGDLRLVEYLDGRKPVELYDRAQDFDEQRNLAEARPEVTARLQEEVRAFAERPPVWEASHVELDEMRIMQLRALGYVGLGKDEEEQEEKAAPPSP